MSQIKALESFLESSHSICIIYEDDYEPVCRSTYWSTIKQLFNDRIKFDLILLSYNELKSSNTHVPYLQKVNSSMTASGYIITRKFAEILVQHWKDCLKYSIEEQENLKINTGKYCCDVYWNTLLKSYDVYCFYPRIGIQRESYSDIQRESYSDIQREYVDYKV
jgi:hypothetical protein